MAAVPVVQRLQARVEELERWVYGPGGSRGSRKVADGLVKVQVALGNIASKRERVKILFKKIEDLIKYLDPEYIDRIAIPDASKLQFILAEEQFILSQIALLEQVEALVPMLDSAHIKGVCCPLVASECCGSRLLKGPVIPPARPQAAQIQHVRTESETGSPPRPFSPLLQQSPASHHAYLLISSHLICISPFPLPFVWFIQQII
ncbi:dynactin subunit 3 isoform X1 [Myotis lucifugus]|uniref:dynactin subunit 3 isoform X1 n=1 Tax=Myotis lucifugus TaxID=59463 RepID=UPI000CCBFFFD|nr:dynactin subunit 3 isoform X1 [Myotis lucifugus]